MKKTVAEYDGDGDADDDDGKDDGDDLTKRQIFDNHVIRAAAPSSLKVLLAFTALGRQNETRYVTRKNVLYS